VDGGAEQREEHHPRAARVREVRDPVVAGHGEHAYHADAVRADSSSSSAGSLRSR